jgi:hypothetical protein
MRPLSQVKTYLMLHDNEPKYLFSNLQLVCFFACILFALVFLSVCIYKGEKAYQTGCKNFCDTLCSKQGFRRVNIEQTPSLLLPGKFEEGNCTLTLEGYARPWTVSKEIAKSFLNNVWSLSHGKLDTLTVSYTRDTNRIRSDTFAVATLQ